MKNEVWMNNNEPYHTTAGAEPLFSFVFEKATSISSPTAYVYKNGTDVTSTNMPTGSASTNSIDTVTLPVLSALVGGNTYIVTVIATINGVVDARSLKVIVRKPGDD